MGARILFVGGLHRSGTTALTRALGRHPDLAIHTGTGVPMDEGQHLQTCLPPASAFGGPGRFGLAPGAHMTEDHPVAEQATAARLMEAWLPYWRPDAPWLVEKSPPNILRTRFLARIFPRSVFVVIERHPAAVSLATRKWAPGLSLDELLRHWFHVHDLLDSDADHLDGRLVRIRYDRFVDAPEECLDRVARLLGVGGFGPVGDAVTDHDAGYRQAWKEVLVGPEGGELVEHWGEHATRHGWDLESI